MEVKFSVYFSFARSYTVLRLNVPFLVLNESALVEIRSIWKMW